MASQWSEQPRGGGSIHGERRFCQPAVWCGGGRHVAVPSGRSLRLYAVQISAETEGEDVKQLTRVKTLSGHSADITAAADLGKYRVISASMDGTAKLWDVSDGAVIRTIDLGMPIVALAAHEGMRHRAYVSVGSELRRIDVMKGRTEAVVRVSCELLVVWPKRDVLVGVRKKTVYMFSGNVGFENQSFVTFQHARNIRAVAAHPHDGSLAVGDEQGVITIYHGVLNKSEGHVRGRKKLKSEALKKSSMHWHASAVLALTYTHEGVDLLSGGSEAALVLWELGTGAKRFLPRIGGAIRAISPRPTGTSYAITCADNALRLMAIASFSIVAEVRGLRLPAAFGAETGTSKITLVPDLREPGTALVVGLPAVVQRYDVWRDEHVDDVLVTPRNELYTYHARGAPGAAPTSKVKLAALGYDSTTLVTVDVLKTAASSERKLVLETLRFSARAGSREPFQLVAMKERPHGDHATTCLVYHPSKHVVVSASAGGDIIFWRRSEETGEWFNAQTCGHREHRCTAAGISADGSTFAAACGSVIVLWFLDRRGIARTDIEPRVLSHAPQGVQLTAIAFAGAAESPFLVATSPKSVHVWNIITSSVWWSARVPVRKLVVDARGTKFALEVRLEGAAGAASKESSSAIAVFDLSRPTPLLVARTPRPLVAMSFLPVHTAERSALILLNDKLELSAVAEDDVHRMIGLNSDADTDDVAVDEAEPLEQEPNGGDGADAEVDLSSQSEPLRRALELFNAPTHTLPPLSVVANKFFAELSAGAQRSEGEGEGEGEGGLEDVEEEEASAPVAAAGARKNRKRQRAGPADATRRVIRDVLLSESMLDGFVESFRENSVQG